MENPTPEQLRIYLEGFIDGLREFAWWKDGQQYVGTCGTTLADAIKTARANYDSGNRTNS